MLLEQGLHTTIQTKSVIYLFVIWSLTSKIRAILLYKNHAVPGKFWQTGSNKSTIVNFV